MNLSDHIHTKPSDDRSEAVHQLLRIAHDGAYRSLIDRSSKPKVVALVSTVTRWRRYLTFLLHNFLRSPSMKLPPTLEQLLLIGIAELVLLNGTPYAVVNEIVNLARAMKLNTGLTNAVLRSVVRAQNRLPEPQTGNQVRDMAIQWSHPTWLTRRYVHRFGINDAVQLMKHNNEPPHYSIRVNQMKTTTAQLVEELRKHGISTTQSGLLEHYIRINSIGSLIREGYFEQGLCSVHDESAGLAVAMLDPQPDEIILDACAAPGGKALAIACQMQGSGQLHAWDRHPKRLQKLEEQAHLQGLENIRTDVVNLLEGPELKADRVMIDVPCTGTGVLNKRPDLRWNRSETDLVDLLHVQKCLLDASVDHVRPGGFLVYSTCSIEPEENEGQVDSFLRRHPEFILQQADNFLPPEVVTSTGFMATLPHRHEMDGAFAVRFQKHG